MGLISGILGGFGSLFGGLGRNAAVRRQQAALRDAQADAAAWYNKNYNEDATQRADAQRMLTRTLDAMRERTRSAAGSAAVTGASEESVAAAKQGAAATMADTASQIAAAGAARKDTVDSQYQQRKQELDEESRKLAGGKFNTWDFLGEIAGGVGKGIGAGI